MNKQAHKPDSPAHKLLRVQVEILVSVPVDISEEQITDTITHTLVRMNREFGFDNVDLLDYFI